jgi:hypothetical protein
VQQFLGHAYVVVRHRIGRVHDVIPPIHSLSHSYMFAIPAKAPAPILVHHMVMVKALW